MCIYIYILYVIFSYLSWRRICIGVGTGELEGSVFCLSRWFLISLAPLFSFASDTTDMYTCRKSLRSLRTHCCIASIGLSASQGLTVHNWLAKMKWGVVGGGCSQLVEESYQSSTWIGLWSAKTIPFSTLTCYSNLSLIDRFC